MNYLAVTFLARCSYNLRLTPHMNIKNARWGMTRCNKWIHINIHNALSYHQNGWDLFYRNLNVYVYLMHCKVFGADQ